MTHATDSVPAGDADHSDALWFQLPPDLLCSGKGKLDARHEGTRERGLGVVGEGGAVGAGAGENDGDGALAVNEIGSAAHPVVGVNLPQSPTAGDRGTRCGP